MIGTRFSALINQPVLLGFRHLYNNVLADAEEIIEVEILDQNFKQIAMIPGSQVARVDVGSYQVTAPGNLFSYPGIYYDVWHIRSTPTSTPRNLRFEISVVIIPQNQTVNFSQVLSCKLEDLDACMLKKNYLWPVWSVLSNGYYLADSVLQNHIDISITKLQRELDLPLVRKRVRTRPFASNAPNLIYGTDYDEEGRLIDWNFQDSQIWSQIKLPHTGISKIWSVRGIYGGRTVYDIPVDWVSRNELQNGFVRIRPTTAGSIANIVDGSGRFLDVTLLEAIGQSNVPGFWAVDYDYGPIGYDTFNDGIPKELCDIVMKHAAIIILDQLGQAIGRGLVSRSASVDGLSSSIGTVANAERTMFGALVATYQRDLDATNMSELRKYYKGPSVFIL